MEEIGGILRIDLDLIPRNSLDPEVPPKLRGVDLISLVISDTGCGMSPEVMDRLFDPFFTTKEVGKGTGLGLSVVHGIVVAHQGEIRISSEPGCGTAVKIFLPQAVVEVPPGGDRGAPAPRIGPARILLVDDERDICDFGEAVLGRQGHEVSTFQDSLQALSRLRENPGAVDLVITDLTMPHLTGLQLAAEVTSLRPDLPVILITGVNDKPDWELGPRRIISAVLHKPFDQESLCRMVDQLLRDAGAARESS
jgi:CheY-like chemotaxis protein